MSYGDEFWLLIDLTGDWISDEFLCTKEQDWERLSTVYVIVNMQRGETE
jgi:hypothetical protein